jgi:hypothetical protein
MGQFVTGLINLNWGREKTLALIISYQLENQA